MRGYSSFGQGTPKIVVVGATSTTLLSANASRLYAQVNNNGASPIWVQVGVAAVVGRGTKVFPGGMFNFEGNELFLGVINAVTQAGTVNTEVIEGIE